MSLRPTQTASLGQPAAAAEVLAIIKQAQAAHAAWEASNSASVDAPSSWRETLGEAWYKWTLSFMQKVEYAGMYGGYKVVHEIVLSDGVYSRMQGMVDALTEVIEPVYLEAGWKISKVGAVTKVCSDNALSTGRWGFTYVMPPRMADEYDKTQMLENWVLPGDVTNPERALRVAFGVPMATIEIKADINDVSYIIKEKYPEVVGELATFTITRASWVKDKVSA